MIAVHPSGAADAASGFGRPQPHSWSAAICIDEFDAGLLERAANDLQGCPTRRVTTRFKLPNRHYANSRFFSE